MNRRFLPRLSAVKTAISQAASLGRRATTPVWAPLARLLSALLWLAGQALIWTACFLLNASDWLRLSVHQRRLSRVSDLSGS